MDLDQAWKQWSTSQAQPDFEHLMSAANPVIDNALTTFAPASPPAVRSRAKVLTAQAMKSFDPTKGVKLKTHIFNQLQPLYRESGAYETLHVPERVHLDIQAMKRASSRFKDEFGRDPSDQELAEHSKISIKRLGKLRKYDKPQLMESAFSPDEESESDANLPATEQMAKLFDDYAYHSLSGPDQAIIDMRLGRNGQKPMKLSAIAKKLKISPSAVSQRLSRIEKIYQEAAALEEQMRG